MITRSLLSFIFLLTSYLSFAQDTKELPPPPAMTMRLSKVDQRNKECLHRNKFSLEERLKFYPFNLAKEVKAVSFDNKPDSNGLIKSNGKLPFKNDSIDYSQLDEIIILTPRLIETLTDILYNTGYKKQPAIVNGSCYNPRNALLFIDSTGKTFAFIELCFECRDYRKSSEKVETGEFCNQKYELLKNYFKDIGIEIGTVKGIGL